MHKRSIMVALALAGVVAVAGPSAQRAGGQAAAPAGTVLVLETDKGNVEIELYDKDAPKTIEHVLVLVRRGFYRGQRFHWVQPGLVQVGDPNSRNMALQNQWGEGGSGTRIGVAEFTKRPFERGSVGIAYRNGQTPTDADSQFFICKGANPQLLGKYTMFGHVTKGMEVVDKIERSDILKMMYVKGETPK
ncbi:MAG: peptidylprolyl isomerase [Vicinamibacterales bacterium]